MVTQITKNNVQTACAQTLDHQKNHVADERLQLLDELSNAVLSSAIYSPNGGLAGIGIIDIIFPRDYSKYVEKLPFKSTTVPCFHHTEFLVEGEPSTKLTVNFNFLQPKIRRLREIRQYADQTRRINIGKLIIDEKVYSKDFEEPIDRTVILENLVSAIITSPIEQDFSFQRGEEPIEEIKDKSGVVRAEYIRESTPIKGSILLSAEPMIGLPKVFKVTVRITNTTESLSKGKNFPSKWRFNKEEVLKKSFLAAHTLIKINGGKANIGDPLSCANINTSPAISKIDENTIFSSPIIAYDYPKTEPIPMEKTLDAMTADEDSLLGSMNLLSQQEKDALKTTGKSKQVFQTFRALLYSNPKLKSLYKFQFDAIQVFIKKVLSNDPQPLIVLAPTGSGKSLVFYVCAVLMKLLRDDLNGTIAFITFPTRALNSQQFSEMVEFFYHLNKLGSKATLGLYMGGKQWDDSTWASVVSLKPQEVEEGQELPNINRCPACKHDKIVAKKADKDRILPVCEKCGQALDYVYLSNKETEAFCPNVIVGTPDKIVNSLSTNVYAHTLFGAPSKKCPKCQRYTALVKKDQNYPVINCKCGTPMGPETITKSTPCFVVFDEVHTLVGTQGNLFGQFLSLMRVLNQFYGGPEKYWYLGATATIVNRDELICNLTGYANRPEQTFPLPENSQKYFVKNDNRVRHRYLLLEPLDKKTRWSISWITASLHSFLNKALDEDRAIIQSLNQKYKNVNLSYKTQTVYVTRKDEGRDLEKYLPDMASAYKLGNPYVTFGYGDLSTHQLTMLNKLVRDNKIDILLVTQIYGQGVDFPGLNILHFFGTPKTFIELAQVVGRTGRDELPSLVLLHLLPNIPRDIWVYQNFRTAIKEMDQGILFEPTPINVHNRYAINLSLPNVFNVLVMARSIKDHQMRYAEYVNRYFNKNSAELIKLLEQIEQVYVRNDTIASGEKQKIRQLILRTVRDLIMDFRDSHTDTSDHLLRKQILIPTLRERKKQVRYYERMRFPVVEQLGMADDLALRAFMARKDEEEEL
jgi:superfamily II DNA/RNA helicase